jgi:hypothetical protein
VRVTDGRVPVRQFHHAAPRGGHRRKLACGRGKREDGVERREREEGEGCDEHPVEGADLVGRDSHREHAHDRHAADEDHQGVREAGHEGVTAAEVGQLAIQ